LDKGMKKLLAAMFVALLMVGCAKPIEIPKMIECDACGEKVSSTGEACLKCGHPIAESADAYVKAHETLREQMEENFGAKILESVGGDSNAYLNPSGLWYKDYEILAIVDQRSICKIDAGRWDYEIPRELDLSGVGIRDLWSLRKRALAEVGVLDLSGNGITDLTPITSREANWWNTSASGAEKFADFTIKQLTVLNLAANPITDISPLRPLVNLKRLNLSATRVTDISPLFGLTNLQELDLSYSKVRLPGQDEMLKKALPECHIKF
jgi:hypothetical protein